jgi:hypothetical protein
LPKLEEAPKFEKTEIPVGKHVLTLVQVKAIESPNTFPDAKKELNAETGVWEAPMRREWIWNFQSETIDPINKKPFEFSVFTPRFYNGASTTNKLTLLMRQLAPEANDEERKAMIEMDHLIGKKWQARLVKAMSKNNKEFITYNSFEPIESEPAGDEIPFSSAGTETPAASTAVSVAVKAELGKAMLLIGAGPDKDRFKNELLIKLGQLRYASYAEFIDLGHKDELLILNFVQNWTAQ